MITKKTPAEIAILKEAGNRLALILEDLAREVVVGSSALSIDDRAMELSALHEVEPVLLGYHPSFAPVPYPAAVCVSVNNCVQHGIPTERIVFKEGDVVNLDMSIGYRGLIVDAGLTVGVGAVSPEAKKLIFVTKSALKRGIAAARPGGRIGDIGATIERYVKEKGFSIVSALCGHGVGYAVHEEPTIPNFGKAGRGPLIEVGHVYAIEPIVAVGDGEVYFDDAGDGYSVYTKDGSLSAHFEHTVAITKDGPLVLTTTRQI
jgi:methionyl aminopeptidase